MLNACGLAISNFYLHWFFRNLSFFERDPHMDSQEGIRVKKPKFWSTGNIALQEACPIGMAILATWGLINFHLEGF
jgi:hypothetical protein